MPVLVLLVGLCAYIVFESEKSAQLEAEQQISQTHSDYLSVAQTKLNQVQSLFNEVQQRVDRLPSLEDGCAQNNLALQIDPPNLREYLDLAEEGLGVMLAEQQNLQSDTGWRVMSRRYGWISGIGAATTCLLQTILVYAQLLDGEDGYDYLVMRGLRVFQDEMFSLMGEDAQYSDVFINLLASQQRLAESFVNVLYRSRSFCRPVEIGEPWSEEGDL